MTRTAVLLACGALSLATACGAPFAIKRNVLGAQRQAASNVLTTGELSRRTRNVLYQQDLITKYDDDPAGAIAELHAALVRNQLQPDAVVALAETAFYHARTAAAAGRTTWPRRSTVGNSSSPTTRATCPIASVRVCGSRPSSTTAGSRKGSKRMACVDLRAGSYPLPVRLARDRARCAGPSRGATTSCTISFR